MLTQSLSQINQTKMGKNIPVFRSNIQILKILLSIVGKQKRHLWPDTMETNKQDNINAKATNTMQFEKKIKTKRVVGKLLFEAEQKCTTDIFDNKFENSMNKRKNENKLQYSNINEKEDVLFKQIKGNIQEKSKEPNKTKSKRQSKNNNRMINSNNKDYIYSNSCRFCKCVDKNIENIEHKTDIEFNKDSEKNHPPADFKITNLDINVDSDFFTIPNQNVQNENNGSNNTHTQLDQGTTKATHREIIITGTIEEIEHIIDFLIKNNRVKAMKGQMKQSKSEEQKDASTNNAEKGEFKYSKCKKYDQRDQAVQLMRKLGPRKAEEEWAEKQLPYEVFKKAKNQYQFEIRNQRNKELQSPVEKSEQSYVSTLNT